MSETSNGKTKADQTLASEPYQRFAAQSRSPAIHDCPFLAVSIHTDGLLFPWFLFRGTFISPRSFFSRSKLLVDPHAEEHFISAQGA